MGEYTAIADVGETLVSLLRDRMSDLVSEREVALLSPAAIGANDDIRLSLYLYDVSENPHMRNDDSALPEGTSRPDEPLRLDLRYLLTPYPSKGGSDETANTKAQHMVLGRAMQVLQDESILTGSVLEGSFGTDESLHVSILPRTREEIVDIWSTFTEEPYQPSVAYLVTPVVVESTREEPFERVIEFEADTYAAEEADADE